MSSKVSWASLRTLALVLCVGLFSGDSTRAAPIRDLIGEIELSPTTIDGLSLISDAENIDGVLHVVGKNGERPARQLVDLSTGVVSLVEDFMTIDQMNGLSGLNGNVTTITPLAGGAQRTAEQAKTLLLRLTERN